MRSELFLVLELLLVFERRRGHEYRRGLGILLVLELLFLLGFLLESDHGNRHRLDLDVVLELLFQLGLGLGSDQGSRLVLRPLLSSSRPSRSPASASSSSSTSSSSSRSSSSSAVLELHFVLELHVVLELVEEGHCDRVGFGLRRRWLLRLGLELHLRRQCRLCRQLRVQLRVQFGILLRNGLRIRLVGPTDGVHDPIESSLDACGRNCPVFRIQIGFVIDHCFPVEVGVVDVQLEIVDVHRSVLASASASASASSGSGRNSSHAKSESSVSSSELSKRSVLMLRCSPSWEDQFGVGAVARIDRNGASGTPGRATSDHRAPAVRPARSPRGADRPQGRDLGPR